MEAEPTASTSSLVHEGVASGLSISLHPLPILSISEHYTRTRLQTGKPDVQVYGALLGTQTGREIEIVNSFEFAAPGPEGEAAVDHGFFKTRQDQFKQVFPTLDFMGWYAIGSTPTRSMLKLHDQLLAYSESPLLLLLSPNSQTPSSPPAASKPTSAPQVQSHDLPVAVFESTTEIVSNEPVQLYIRCAYTVETGEAERVAVDGVAKPSGSVSRTGESESALVANLTTQRNAIDMLLQRVRLIVHYLDLVSAHRAKPDHELLRQISSLAASLPSTSAGTVQGGTAFKEEYMKEINDVLLTSLLASQTKSLSDTNDLFDKFLFLSPDRASGPSAITVGGGGAGDRSDRGMSERMMRMNVERFGGSGPSSSSSANIPGGGGGMRRDGRAREHSGRSQR